MVNVSENYITQIENGRKRPSLALVEEISIALDCKISELLKGEDIIEKLRREFQEEAMEFAK